MSSINNNASNYKSVYPSTSDYMSFTARQVSSPSVSSASLSSINDKLTSVNNDLATLANKLPNETHDSAAFSSDSAKVQSDLQTLSQLAAQAGASSNALSSQDAATEKAFLGDINTTASGAAGGVSWGDDAKATSAAQSSAAAVSSAISSASASLGQAASTGTASTTHSNAGITNDFAPPVTYDWQKMANLASNK